MAENGLFVVVKGKIKDAFDPDKTRFTAGEDAGKNGFGTGKVGKWLNKQVNRMTDDNQTKLGEKPSRSDKTPSKSKEPQTYTQQNVSYTTPYKERRAVPAAMTVAESFAKNNDGKNPVPDDGLLGYSLFNRYALYNYRGFYGGDDKSLSNLYSDVNNESKKFRGEELRGIDTYDVTEQKIIKYYNEHLPYIAYSPTDFLYNRYFQEIPVNHLITLRRFAMPVEDNIFTSEVIETKETGKATKTAHLSTCTATTYFGEKTDNKLDEILKFTGVGLTWEPKTADIQEIQAGVSTKGPGAFDAKFGTVKSGLFATLSGKSAGDIYKAEAFGGASDPMHKYSSFVLGPVNVINSTNIRGRGINFKNEYTLNFEYELKSWYMVNPKIAMLDILSNMLVMTTNNGNFWGGGWRYTGGQSQSRITDLYGDSSLLRKGDFIGYAQSVVTDVVHGNSKGVKGVTQLFGDGSGAFSFKSILGGIKDILQNILTQRIGSFMDAFAGGLQNPGADIPQALLSAQPTGYWHVTVGNPLNPIAIMGNMICKDNDFVLGGGLGYDDFPMEFKVSVKLEHGKPRDRSDIENMFNMGHGRIYAAPADDDMLNIIGKEVQEYGVYPTGPGMHMGIAEVADNIGLGREHVANIISMDILS